jgi:hypothetical protein
MPSKRLVYRKLIEEITINRKKMNTVMAAAKPNWLPRPEAAARSKVKVIRMSVDPPAPRSRGWRARRW